MSTSNGESTLPARVNPALVLAGLSGGRRKLAGAERVSDKQLGVRARELRIMHAVRQRSDTHKPGQLQLDRELFDAMDIVLLSVQGFRALLEGDKNPRTVCASSDGLVPHDGVPIPRSPECPSCEYAQWDRSAMDHGGKAKKPPCGEAFAFIGVRYDVPEPLAFYFLCRNTAARAAQKFLAEADRNPQLRVPALYEMVIHLTTKEEHSEVGKLVWYTPVFTVAQYLAPEEYVGLAEAAAAYTYVPPVDAGASAAAAADDEPPAEVDVPVAPEGTVPF